MGQGSSRVFGYKESQANNVLSHVSHGDPTTVAIVASIAADHLWPFLKRFLASPFLTRPLFSRECYYSRCRWNKLFFPATEKGNGRSEKRGGSSYSSNVCVLNACRNFEKGGIPIVISDFFIGFWVIVSNFYKLRIYAFCL